MTVKIKPPGCDSRGFSFLELMVVIVILGILAMYIAPKLMGRTDEARMQMARVQIKALARPWICISLITVFTPARSRACRL